MQPPSDTATIARLVGIPANLVRDLLDGRILLTTELAITIARRSGLSLAEVVRLLSVSRR